MAIISLLPDDALNVAIGEDLRRIREESGLTQEAVKDILGLGFRSAFSKIERGHSSISLQDYLRLMAFYRDIVPNHPGVVLASYPPFNQKHKRP